MIEHGLNEGKVVRLFVKGREWSAVLGEGIEVLSRAELEGYHAELEERLGYNRDDYSKVSFFNLDNEASQALYNFKKFDIEFQKYVAGLLLDILVEMDGQYEGRNCLAQRHEEILS